MIKKPNSTSESNREKGITQYAELLYAIFVYVTKFKNWSQKVIVNNL